MQKYYEDTPSDHVTKDAVAAAMRSSIKDSTEKLYKKLSKITAVASPALSKEWLLEVFQTSLMDSCTLFLWLVLLWILVHWLLQIKHHWSLFTVPELTLEKLQMIATANVPAKYKVRRLRWMNAYVPSQEARRLPPRPMNEDKLLVFLIKACFYARVSYFLTSPVLGLSCISLWWSLSISLVDN